MKRIAVLTSGGDAAGMNAAIRSVARCGIDRGWEVLGIKRGFSGLIEGDSSVLRARDVGGIIQRGGTILGSARCDEFRSEAGRRRALESLTQMDAEGLVVIGGNGSQTGSHALSKMGFPVVGIASTIDNDLCGSEITIGVDTALNIALEAIDRLKVTASSHHRAFLVETMGRKCGYIALAAGISGGAEAVVIPEFEVDPERLADVVHDAYERGKAHAIIVVAEGATCNATQLAAYFSQHRERLGFEFRATILGHVQRGGAPGAFDRLLATRFGGAAVELLAERNFGRLVGLVNGAVSSTPFDEVVGQTKRLDPQLIELSRILAKY